MGDQVSRRAGCTQTHLAPDRGFESYEFNDGPFGGAVARFPTLAGDEIFICSKTWAFEPRQRLSKFVKSPASSGMRVRACPGACS